MNFNQTLFFQVCFKQFSLTFHRWITYQMWQNLKQNAKDCTVTLEIVSQWSSWSSWFYLPDQGQQRSRICCSENCVGEAVEFREARSGKLESMQKGF